MHALTRLLAAALVGGAFIAPAVTRASSRHANLPTVNIALNGKSMTVSGTLQSGAVDIRTTTTGEGFGGPLLIWLRPGVTVQQVFTFLRNSRAQGPDSAAQFGAIVMDAGTPRGVSEVQTVLRAGQYIAFDSANQNQGPTSWPRTTFTVTRGTQPAALPPAQATIHIIDFGFQGPVTLRAGQTLRIFNNGYLAHMAIAIGARSRPAAQEIAALLRAGKENQAQRLASGFLSLAGPLSHNSSQQFAVPPRPGLYVMGCFLDTQDGRAHARLGMTRIIRIVR